MAKICYYFLRTGHLFSRKITEENLYAAIFLCEQQSSPLLAFLSPELNDKITLTVTEKIKFLGQDLKDLFPFQEALSDEINTETFALSFLSQPHLYLRSRPGRQAIVLSALKEQNIETIVEENCIQLKNAVDLSTIKGLNKNFVIQDKQSQQVFSNLPEKNIKSVWDCCAASGGKSILLVDTISEKIQLSISDIRKNILENGKERLAIAGIPIYNADIKDLTRTGHSEGEQKFDLIICDVPCTGSGTWARTPEQLYFFKKQQLTFYTDRQLRIAKNVSTYLNPGGLLIYITCSVFNAENESIVSKISSDELDLLSKQYYKGYEEQADSLFVAIFQKQ